LNGGFSKPGLYEGRPAGAFVSTREKDPKKKCVQWVRTMGPKVVKNNPRRRKKKVSRKGGRKRKRGKKHERGVT